MIEQQQLTLTECDEVGILLIAFYVVLLHRHISMKYYERHPPFTDEETEAQRLRHLPEVKTTHCA